MWSEARKHPPLLPMWGRKGGTPDICSRETPALFGEKGISHTPNSADVSLELMNICDNCRRSFAGSKMVKPSGRSQMMSAWNWRDKSRYFVGGIWWRRSDLGGGVLVEEVGFWGCFWCGGGRVGGWGLKYLKEKSIYYIFCNKFDIICSIARVYRIFTYTIVFSVKISIQLIYHMVIFIMKFLPDKSGHCARTRGHRTI